MTTGNKSHRLFTLQNLGLHNILYGRPALNKNNMRKAETNDTHGVLWLFQLLVTFRTKKVWSGDKNGCFDFGASESFKLGINPQHSGKIPNNPVELDVLLRGLFGGIVDFQEDSRYTGATSKKYSRTMVVNRAGFAVGTLNGHSEKHLTTRNGS